MPRGRLIHCEECGRNRLHYARGLCQQCWNCQYYADHHEELTEYHRQYRATHREQRRERKRQWRGANPDKKREADRLWQRANPDKGREIHRRYREAHSNRVRDSNHRRRALRANAPGNGIDERLIYRLYNGRCAYCDTRLHYHERTTWHIDHIVPLSKGGADDNDNAALACAPCNMSKSDRDVSEWLSTRQILV